MKPKDLIQYIDFTRLVENDSEENIVAFCEKADTSVASICVYPEFISTVKNITSTPVATVINFPHGKDDVETCISGINKAIEQNVDEIDVVIPYHNLELCYDFLCQIREASKGYCLKAILETGVLNSDEIKQASNDALKAGVDFIKTSTGKVEVGATLEAAEIMLAAIKDVNPDAGLKVSGGIATLEDAKMYTQAAIQIMGEDWISAKHFRIGASRLLDALLTAK